MSTKTEQYRAPPKACVYCGNAAGTTRDHAPPKVIFFEPYPPNLITVPACVECNSSFGTLDSAFIEFISLVSRENSEHRRKLWSRSLTRVLNGNRRRAREIANTLIPPPVGSGVDGAFLFVDLRIQRRMACRIVKGLWFRIFREILPADIPVKAMSMKIDERTILPPFSDRLELGAQFSCCYTRTAGCYDSIWLMDFHGDCHSCVATGEPAAEWTAEKTNVD